MYWLFLIPLTTSFICGYIFNKCADEMAYLTGVATIVGIILSLVLAPWQIQLLILITVILSTKRLLSANEFVLTGEESNKTLNYNRGSNYESTTPTQMSEREILGKYRGGSCELNPSKARVSEREIAGTYRGHPWKAISLPKAVPSTPTFTLKYRGSSTNSQKAQTSEASDLINKQTPENK